MGKDRLALIIPTKDRPEALGRLLRSIEAQGDRPEEVIVVDGGATSVESTLGSFKGLTLRYVRVRPPSLTKQKNVGLAHLEPGVTLVGFLDDDIVLEEGALGAMMKFWGQAGPEVGGAAFTDVAPRPRRSLWMKKLFALDAEEDGRILRSGYNTAVRPQPQRYVTQWLPGGAAVWRREVVNRFHFDEWFTGYSYLEDVEYSLRVRHHYQFMVVPEARLQHHSLALGWRHQFTLGIWQATNRFYLVRKHAELSAAWCAWSLVGQVLVNATTGTVRWGAGGASRAMGNLVGWCCLIVGWPRATSQAGEGR